MPRTRLDLRLDFPGCQNELQATGRSNENSRAQAHTANVGARTSARGRIRVRACAGFSVYARPDPARNASCGAAGARRRLGDQRRGRGPNPPKRGTRARAQVRPPAFRATVPYAFAARDPPRRTLRTAAPPASPHRAARPAAPGAGAGSGPDRPQIWRGREAARLPPARTGGGVRPRPLGLVGLSASQPPGPRGGRPAGPHCRAGLCRRAGGGAAEPVFLKLFGDSGAAWAQQKRRRETACLFCCGCWLGPAAPSLASSPARGARLRAIPTRILLPHRS